MHPAPSFGIPLGEGASLSKIESRDADALFTLLEDERERIAAHERWADPLRSLEQVSTWIAGLRIQDARNERMTAVIRHAEAVVGIVGLTQIDAETLSAALWIWVAAGHEGTGLAGRACRVTLGYGFGELGLERITYVCAAGNARSRVLAARLGFRAEGVMARSAFLPDDSVVDAVLHGMTRQMWPEALQGAERSPVRRATRVDAALVKALAAKGAGDVWVVPGRAVLRARVEADGVARVMALRHVGGKERAGDLERLTRVACGEMACAGMHHFVLEDAEAGLRREEREAVGWFEVAGIRMRSFVEQPLERGKRRAILPTATGS